MKNYLSACSLRILLASLCLGPIAAAQNRDHSGLVHLGDGQWGSEEEALEEGLIEHRGRWYPRKLGAKLQKWERLDSKGLAWEDAYKEKTDYYRVRTNVPRHLFFTEIAPFLDALGDTYVRVFKEDFGLKGRGVRNKDLKIYGSFEEYSLHEAKSSQGLPRNTPGFIVNGAVLVTFYDETDPGQFYLTMFHEGAHQFFLSLLPGADLPIWLTEALATWFEGAVYSRATQEITFGGVPVKRLRRAKQILGTTAGTPQELFMDLPQPEFHADQYALAWSFLHYLLKRPGEGNAKKFARFLKEANGSGVKPIPEVYEKATKEDFGALTEGWRSHVDALALPDERTEWVALAIEGAVEGVRAGDVVWSVDGREVFTVAQFRELLKTRSETHPTELVLIRSDPSFFDPYAARWFERATIEPGSETPLRVGSCCSRHANLRD